MWTIAEIQCRERGVTNVLFDCAGRGAFHQQKAELPTLTDGAGEIAMMLEIAPDCLAITKETVEARHQGEAAD
jgi:hypothetical protein